MSSEYELIEQMRKEALAERARQQSEAAAAAEAQAALEHEQAELAARQRRAELIAADKADREALRRLRGQIEELQLKVQLRQTWRGTSSQFEEEWPRLAQGQTQGQAQEQKQVDVQKREALARWDASVGRFNL